MSLCAGPLRSTEQGREGTVGQGADPTYPPSTHTDVSALTCDGHTAETNPGGETRLHGLVGAQKVAHAHASGCRTKGERGTISALCRCILQANSRPTQRPHAVPPDAQHTDANTERDHKGKRGKLHGDELRRQRNFPHQPRHNLGNLKGPPFQADLQGSAASGGRKEGENSAGISGEQRRAEAPCTRPGSPFTRAGSLTMTMPGMARRIKGPQSRSASADQPCHTSGRRDGQRCR